MRVTLSNKKRDIIGTYIPGEIGGSSYTQPSYFVGHQEHLKGFGEFSLYVFSLHLRSPKESNLKQKKKGELKLVEITSEFLRRSLSNKDFFLGIQEDSFLELSVNQT